MPRNYEETAQDIEETVKWYRTAAEHGYATAQFRLAKLYEYGWGVPQDDQKASRWYHAAAKQGDADAQFELALKHDTWQKKMARQIYPTTLCLSTVPPWHEV